MGSHTPGPWEYFDSYGADGKWPVEPCRHCGREDTAFFLIPGGHGDGECAAYTKADARLIAAAPDLRAALEQWISMAVNSGLEGCDEILEQAEAAIAKATEGTDGQ